MSNAMKALLLNAALALLVVAGAAYWQLDRQGTPDEGAFGVDPLLVDAVRMLGAGRLDIWRKVLLPAALPAVLTGVRVGLGTQLGLSTAVLLGLVLLAIGAGMDLLGLAVIRRIIAIDF